MLKDFIFSTALIFLCHLSFSQKHTGIVKGTIFSADGIPAAYITVELKKMHQLTTTDENGSFLFTHLLPGPDSIVIFSGEAKPFFQQVQVYENNETHLGTIHLQYNVKQLQGIEVRGRITQSYKSNYSFSSLKIQASLKNTPQSVSTVTKELLKDKMEFNLKDAIENVAGVNQYSGYDEYTIRGFRAENPHLINGLRSYNTTLITPLLTNIERIEVIKGPVSVLYANADPGGTINLVTKKPLSNKEASIDFYCGSWNTARAQVDITGPFNKSKKFLYRFNAGYGTAKSFRDQYFNKSFQLAPSFSIIPNNKLQLNIDLSLSHTNTIADRGQPGILNDKTLVNTPVSLSVTQPGDYLKETNIASVISFSYKFNSHVSFSSAWLNYITLQHLAEHGVNDYITPDSVNLYYTNKKFNTATNTISNFATFTFNTGKLQHTFITGYDFIKANVSMNIFNGELPGMFGIGSGIVGTFSLLHPANIQRDIHTYQKSGAANDDADAYITQGIYLQEQLSYKKWSLLFGLRSEFYRAADEEEDNPVNDSTANDAREHVLLPRLALSWSLTPAINLYITYNKGFDPFESSLSRQVFNRAAKPIYSTLYETGLKADLIRNKLSATLSIYQLTLKNVAVNANDPNNPDLFVQRGKEQSGGFEVEVNGNIIPALSMSFSFAHNIAKVKSGEVSTGIGNIKENAPKNSGASWIKYAIPKGIVKNLSFSFGHSQAGKRNTLTAGLQLPGYCVFDAGAAYAYRKFKIAINIFNISNKIYWSSGYNYSSKWAGAPRNCMINFSCKL